MVGIKLADGGFFPILADGRPGSKKTLLTTARDGQKEVHIEIWRGRPGLPAARGEFIADLVLEGLPSAGGEKTDIELSLSLDTALNLSASARDLCSGDYQSLRIAMERPEKDAFALPETRRPSGPRPSAGGPRPNGIAAAAFVVFGLLILSVLAYAVFRFFEAA